MKKSYIKFILITGISILLLYTVAYFNNKNNIEIPNEGDKDVKISIQHEILLKSTEALLVTIKNSNKDIIEFGLDYEIQIKDDETWLEYYKPENINELAISLNKGDSYEQKIYLDDSMNFKANETYRIIKIINDKTYTSNEFFLK